MPCDMSWYVEGRIVYGRIYGTITAEDTLEIGEAFETFAEDYPNEQLHLIMDMRELEKIQLTLFEIASPKYRPYVTEGWTMIVGSPDSATRGFLKFMTTAFSRLLKMRIRTEDTIEATEAFLMEVDQSLEVWLKTA